MAIDVQYISLDISKQPTPQQVRLGQGDANATQLVVSVYDEGIAYDLTGYSVRLETRLPNSDTYYSVDGTRSGNVATFDIDETYAATSYGFDGFGYVDILSGDTVICSTSRFQLVVLRNAQEGADPSTAYSNGIREATERAIAAAESAEGVVLQDVPLMSATVRGGAQLGTGLEVTNGVLSVDSATVPIPTMSATTKGGAKLGDGLSVADDTLSLSGESYTSAEKTKLAGIEANANNYTLPTMDATTKGGAKLGDGLSIANDVLSVDASSVTSGTLPVAQGGTGATSESAALENFHVGDTVEESTSSFVSVPDNTYKTIKSFALAAGTWVVFATIEFTGNSTGRRVCIIGNATNDSSYVNNNFRNTSVPVANANTRTKVGGVIAAASSTTYYLKAYHNAGEPLNVSGIVQAVRIR